MPTSTAHFCLEKALACFGKEWYNGRTLEKAGGSARSGRPRPFDSWRAGAGSPGERFRAPWPSWKGGKTVDKKSYEALELEVVRFEAEDVITTSGDEVVDDSPK